MANKRAIIENLPFLKIILYNGAMANLTNAELVALIEETLNLYGITLGEDEKLEAIKIGDFSGIIAKTQEHIDALQNNTQAQLEQGKMSREEFEEYAQDPKNFSKSDWEMLERVRTTTEQIKSHTKRLVEDKIGLETIEKAELKKSKRKSQRFAKRKDWLSL